MPLILDNIERATESELLTTLGSSYRLDAAIGYFNLRGWKLLADAVDALPKRDSEPKARVLVGMSEAPAEEMRRLARQREREPTGNRTAARRRGEAVSEYRLRRDAPSRPNRNWPAGWPSAGCKLTDPDRRSRIGLLQESLHAVGSQLVIDATAARSRPPASANSP